MLLEVKNLTKNFAGLTAVNNVSLHVREGEILAIVGPNGAGKSVLFGLISGLLRPTSGQIHLQGEEITGLKPHRIARQGIARTFQTTALFDQLRVVDNLAIGHRLRTTGGFWSTLLHSRRWEEDKSQTTARVMETLNFIGLTEKAFHFVSTLSQAEQKRLSIGVALVSRPKMILLDEPTGGLILEDTDEITDLIKKIFTVAGITICLIEHKMRMVMGLANRMVVLNFGSVIAEGTPAEISNNPEVIEAYLGGNSLLKLVNVSTLIGGFQAVREISLEIPRGDFVTLLGSNGAGKTTLFRTIAGVLKPFRGTIEFKGRQIQGMPANKIVGLGLSLCPEGRQLFPQLSVYKNLTLGAYTRRKDRKGFQQSLEQVYALFPILQNRENQLAGTFSGGEQQMLAIARALMSAPELLLLDEPSMGLAPLVVRNMAAVVKTINEGGTTLFLSEQNANMALMIARRGYVVENGKLVMEGLSAELRNNEKVKKAYIGA